MTEQTYTVKEVSAMMRVHPLTVIRWIRAKKLVGYKVGPEGGKGHWKVSKEALNKVMGTVAHGVEQRVS